MTIFPDSLIGSCGRLCGVMCGFLSAPSHEPLRNRIRTLTRGLACGLICGLPVRSAAAPQGARTSRISPGTARAGCLGWDARSFCSLPGPPFTREALAAPVSYDFYYAENRHINFRAFEKCGPVIRGCVCPDAQWHRAREVQR